MKGAKGEQRKQELLNIAYQMFIQKGYEETGTENGWSRRIYKEEWNYFLLD